MSSIIKQANLLFNANSPVKVNISQNLENAMVKDERNINDSINETKELIIEDSYSKKKEELESLLIELEKEVKFAQDKYNDALKEADDIKNNALQEAEGIKNSAYEEGKMQGYNEGIMKANNELEESKNKLLKEVEDKKNALEEEKKSFVMSIQKKVPELVSNLFKFSFEKECQTNNQMMQALILKGLSELSDEKSIRVLVSEEDYNLLDKDNIAKEFSNMNSKVEISFSYDRKLKKGDCLIETNTGYIDASIDALSECIMILTNDNISYEE